MTQTLLSLEAEHNALTVRCAALAAAKDYAKLAYVQAAKNNLAEAIQFLRGAIDI